MSENQEQKQNVYKVTLSTKRVVLLKEMKIEHQRLATKMLGHGKMNQAEMSLALQENLIKLLLMEIDGEKLSHNQKDNLDNLFSVKEYAQLIKVVSKINEESEDGSEGEAEIETQLI